jgi:hypothetical protein
MNYMTCTEIGESVSGACAEGKVWECAFSNSWLGGFGINKAFSGDVEEVVFDFLLGFSLCKSFTSDFTQFLGHGACSVGISEGDAEEQKDFKGGLHVFE